MNSRPNTRSQFLAIWTGEFVSLIGSSLSSFGIATWVYSETHNPGAMATLVFWKFATQIYLSLFAGHLVDHWPKRRALLVANCGLLVVSATLLWRFSVGSPALALLYAAMALMGVFDGVKNLAFQALTPMLIPPGSISRFNGLITVFENLPPVLGPPLSAVVLESFGVRALIGADTFSFMLPILILLSVRPAEAPLIQTPRRDFAFGLKYIWSKPALLRIQSFFTIQNFLNGLAAGLVSALILSRASGSATGSATVLATVSSVMSLAAVLGGVWQSSFPVEKRLFGTIVVLTALAALSGRVWIGLKVGVLAWAAGLGLRSFVNPVVSACNQTFWQRRTPREMQGRVFGARRLLGQGLYPIAVAVGGWLSDGATGADLAKLFIWTGALEFLFAVAWLALPNAHAKDRL